MTTNICANCRKKFDIDIAVPRPYLGLCDVCGAEREARKKKPILSETAMSEAKARALADQELAETVAETVEGVFSLIRKSKTGSIPVPSDLFADLKSIRDDSERYEKFRKSSRGYQFEIMDKSKGRAFVGRARRSGTKLVLLQKDRRNLLVLWRQIRSREKHSWTAEIES